MDDNKLTKPDFCPTCGKRLNINDYLELLTTPPEAPFACSKCPKEPKPDGVPQVNGLTAPPGSIGYSPSPTAQTADAADNYNPNYPGRDRPPQKPMPWRDLRPAERKDVGCYYCGDLDVQLWPLFSHDQGQTGSNTKVSGS